MIFTQNINLNQSAVNQEFMKICESHPGCKDCPLKIQDMEIDGQVVRCETGKNKK